MTDSASKKRLKGAAKVIKDAGTNADLKAGLPLAIRTLFALMEDASINPEVRLGAVKIAIEQVLGRPVSKSTAPGALAGEGTTWEQFIKQGRDEEAKREGGGA